MQRRPTSPIRTRDSHSHRRGRSLALALSLASCCIAACETSQLLFVTPSAGSSHGVGDDAFLARAGDRSRPPDFAGQPAFSPDSRAGPTA